MAYIPRAIGNGIRKAARAFPAVIVTGPRRAGKTTLLRKLFPHASFYLLEDPDRLARVREDPRGFLAEVKTPAILDEVQNAPELFNYVRSRIDTAPRRMGQWLFTGSQDIGLMQGVTESMAGRAAVFHLLPLATGETSKVSLLRGGFPEVLARPREADLWFRSYVQTYLERDVRMVTSIRDLATFRRFLSLLASRCGQVLNKTDLAAPLGVTIPTITQWIGILETTGQVLLVPPFFENFGKRLTKSPKIYFVDTGLLCHLLGVNSLRELRSSPFAGPAFESFVASEIVKVQLAAGKRREIYFFRDAQGLEVDFLVPLGNARLALVEAKASATVVPQDSASLRRLIASIDRYRTEGYVVFQPRMEDNPWTALAPQVRAVDLGELLTRLGRR